MKLEAILLLLGAWFLTRTGEPEVRTEVIREFIDRPITIQPVGEPVLFEEPVMDPVYAEPEPVARPPPEPVGMYEPEPGSIEEVILGKTGLPRTTPAEWAGIFYLYDVPDYGRTYLSQAEAAALSREGISPGPIIGARGWTLDQFTAGYGTFQSLWEWATN